MFPVDRMLLYILDLITFSSFVSFLGNFALGSHFSISGPLLKPLQGNSMDSKQQVKMIIQMSSKPLLDIL